MKKILSVLLFLFILTGCTIPIEYNNVSDQQINEIKQSITEELLNQDNSETLQSIKDDIRQEVLNELKEQLLSENREKLSDIENMIMNIVVLNDRAVLGVSNYSKIDGNYQEVSTGTGVIYKNDGDVYYLVTNAHVVEDAEKLQVVLNDDSHIEATLIGSDKESDIAILEFTTIRELGVAKFADSDIIKRGQICIAMGNPLGYDYYGTVTMGIISGLSRSMDIDYDEDGIIDWEATLIQHDASISPGNSGGPLFDIDGKIVGINNMKIVDSDVANIGFAIPSNTVVSIISQLEDGGVIRPSLGIIGSEVESVLNNPDFSIPEGITKGIYIAEIVPNSSISVTDAQEGDIIIAFNGTEISNFTDLRVILYGSNVGDLVTLSILRNGEEMDLSFELLERK